MYKNDPTVEADTEARKLCLLNVLAKVTPEHNAAFMAPFRSDEVREACQDLPTGETLGQNNIPT
jgi:hypothetical protein